MTNLLEDFNAKVAGKIFLSRQLGTKFFTKLAVTMEFRIDHSLIHRRRHSSILDLRIIQDSRL
jgi:hypothetical protein